MAYEIYTTEFDEVRDFPSDFSDFELAHIQQAKMSGIVDHYSKDVVRPDMKSAGRDPAFFLDCSGSMRGNAILRTVCAMITIGDELHSKDQPFEILGFTTPSWMGGQSRKKWLDNGRKPLAPGRLNDLLHLVIKDMDTPWPEARDNLLILLREGMLKENIDGEALAWARERIEAREADQMIIAISDGNPCDDSTMSANHIEYLNDHHQAELEKVAMAGIPYQRVLIGSNYPVKNSIHTPFMVRHDGRVESFVEAIAGAYKALCVANPVLEKKADESPDPV